MVAELIVSAILNEDTAKKKYFVIIILSIISIFTIFAARNGALESLFRSYIM